ncbi:MAG: hypothetical protein ACI915_005478, partial [Gammaproteobacteria bacterium]
VGFDHQAIQPFILPNVGYDKSFAVRKYLHCKFMRFEQRL